jgi:hypothetical protein
MSMLRLLAIVLIGCTLIGCQETPVAVPLRSLKASGDVAFVCRGPDGRGLPIDACPDVEGGQNHLIGLVTQKRLGEVAVVDTTSLAVVDVEPTVPGFSFLPIGENPVDIVSTPGGEATFVGVAAVGKEGIFALPTSCIGRPGEGDPVRDLTLWPACALPDAPGDMAILIEPPAADGTVGRSCDDPTPETDPPSATSLCPADLGLELAPAGRRKLAVALPDRGQIAIIDAQGLLNRAPGSFAPCDVERYVSLQVDLPSTFATERIPADLQAEGCEPEGPQPGPRPGSFFPRPAGFAVSANRMYVADLDAPVVHVLDVASPCNVREEPPLLPVSFDQPKEVVPTRRVAVSPVTSRGQQFVYAIDDRNGSVMAFDVTPGSTERTPIVRPGIRIPFEAPDRIGFSHVNDVVFALRDIPIHDPATGVAVLGTHCEPDPAADPFSPAVGYRPTADLSSGASPAKLRGVFAFLLLSSGQVAVVDVDDFDAECRRPIETNFTSEPDFHGCAGDVRSAGDELGKPVAPDFLFTNNNLTPPDGRPTVSDELSCGVVQEHRSRSAVYMVNRSERGVRAPALRAFPRLSGRAGTLTTDQSDEGKNFPKLLAVDFKNPEAPASPQPAMVYVGTTLHVHAADAENPLETDPAIAERASLVLPLAEPRSYVFDDDLSLTFEGPVVLPRPVGRVDFVPGSTTSLVDRDANFCNLGVEDVDLARERGESELALTAAELDAFKFDHADFVQITAALYKEEDSYWQSEVFNPDCGVRNRDLCEDVFGDISDTGELDRNRDFRILQAFQDHLVIEPVQSDGNPQCRLDLLKYCFPSLHEYQVRAANQWVLRGSSSGFRHDVVAVPEDGFRCERDCNPRRKLLQARVFEISVGTGPCSTPQSEVVGAALGVGQPVGPEHKCVFENLTARFAVYRGLLPSERDMKFTWTTIGSFRPLLLNLATTTTNVLPQSMLFVPQIGQLAVVDAASLGLTFMSLDTLGTTRGMQFF